MLDLPVLRKRHQAVGYHNLSNSRGVESSTSATKRKHLVSRLQGAADRVRSITVTLHPIKTKGLPHSCDTEMRMADDATRVLYHCLRTTKCEFEADVPGGCTQGDGGVSM